MKTINLLFSVDDNYVSQLKTVLWSIRNNTMHDAFNVYVLQKKALKYNQTLEIFCQSIQMTYIPIIIGETEFKNAPATDRWPESIYYRLLAHLYLPEDLDKVIYLDADVLVINDLLPLYDLDLEEYLYAAASHQQLTQLSNNINKIRLNTYEAEGYYNSGILVMNLKNIRQEVKAETIFNYIQENRFWLFLPDQDVLNALYSEKILAIPDEIYNFDARKQLIYELISNGKITMEWIIQHTVILHFCGKDKPWYKTYRNQFTALYKHYQRQADKHLVKSKVTSID